MRPLFLPPGWPACWPVLLAAGIALSACGGDSDPSGGTTLEPPAACALGEPPADWVYPAGPYGDQVGSIFEDIALDDCDGRRIAFGDVLGQSKLTLFNIGAGWCQPCIEETRTLDADIFRKYCGQGLRVVQVLFQDDETAPATKLYCSEWRKELGLSFPVLIDPLFVTQKYFQAVDAQTPINFLITDAGEIVYKETGTPAPDLGQRIAERLLQ